MKILKILLVLIVLFISVSAVSAEGNFTALQDEIDTSTDSIDINQNYVYDNGTDYKLNGGILINKSDFTINGNGYTIDGSNQARIFDITGNNVTISNLIFINGNMTGGLGGALHSSGLIILNNVTFKDNTADSGGAISATGDYIINNAIFTNNNASEDGGAIISWGKLTINNATFTENTASASGGAIYAIGEITINSTLFANNQADFGGALNTWTNTIIDNTTFKNNKGEYGGAISAAGKTTISNAIFTNNTASENGGAIDERSETAIKNTAFTNNNASKNGGAIFTNGNSDQINCTFENNSANNGGAVYFNNGIKNSLINSTFNGNNATRSGGAIFIRGPAENNNITSEFNNNNAKAASGGAIFFYKNAENNNITSTFTNNTASYGAGMFFYSESNNNTINGDFTNNIARSCGGAMFFYSKTNNNKFKGTFIHNEAQGLIDELNGNGGAITFKNTSSNNVLECNFIENSARLYGGALNYRMTPYNITIKGNFIANNALSGGAINFFNGFENVNITGKFIANNATRGGAIAVNKADDSSTTEIPTIANCNFMVNTAARGGAIYIESSGIIKDCNFAYNQAEMGGAIFTNGNANLINNIFKNNSANNGGAIYFNNGIKNSLINSTFNGNNATRSGGAIFIRGPAENNNITSEFNNNNAKAASGGAIFFYKNAENNNITSTFTNNTASYGAGMFFYSESNNNTINGDFTNNIAKSCGGAMFFYSKTNNNKFKGTYIQNEAQGLIDELNGNGGAITFKNTSSNNIIEGNFIENSARLYGGALNYRMTPYNITIKGNFIANNALSGGAINFFNGFENVNITGKFIANNATRGGAIAANKADDSSTTEIPTIANCNFTGNTAARGGAIYFESYGIIKDCNFTANHAEEGGAVFTKDRIDFYNDTFENNSAKEGGAIKIDLIEAHNCVFNNNYAENGGAISFSFNSWISNSTFKNSHNLTYSLIYGNDLNSGIRIINCLFLNSTSRYAAALYNKKNTVIINSTFINLHSQESAGAILLKEMTYAEINNCTFINTTAVKNGGAIFIDTLGSSGHPGRTLISNATFINSSGNFGGALLQLAGDLTIKDSRFINNNVSFDGGAIYASNVNANIYNVSIISNKLLNEDNNGGGIYFEKSNLNISNSNFFNNTKNAIYAYDCNLSIAQSNFENNTEAIHGVFLNYTIEEINLNDDSLILNETDFMNCISKNAINLILVNNNITVTNPPKRFDSREWGWVSSIKNQITDGSCWAFGTIAALESALLKSTGIEYDFSENNIKNNMLKYLKYGIEKIIESGYSIYATQGLLSWLDCVLEEEDTYDELGKVSPIFLNDECIHVQDAIFVGPRKNLTDNDEIKKAIMQCGSLAVEYYCTTEAPDYNNKTHAQYQNLIKESTHVVSVVGWDDSYPKENFLTTPPGDGAWILKDSFGYENGDGGFIYLSYYDISFLNSSYAVGFIFDNTDSYVRNYQNDLSGELTFLNDNNTENVSYKTTYESQASELISGVGTYFKYSGEAYVLNIYVNNELKHTQSGTGPYYGFHTIKLSNEIPVQKGDNFTVEICKASIPILSQSRQHYIKNTTFINLGNGWEDISSENRTVSLKVYTKELGIYTEDLVKIYKNDSKFEADIGVANERVTFEINGGTYARTSDENGIARMAINLNPGNYTIKTTFNGTTVENSIVVLPTLIADNLVKYFRNASQFFITLIDGEGNPVAGKNITMNINGVFYNRLTNENGTAKLNINLNPGDYILTATDPLTGLMMSYNITVLPTLNATDLEMKYRDGSKFMVTVLDGQGKPLANAKVTFNINGVLYTRTSDSEGIAKLNINLMAGKYIITSEYDGMRISNTITIKD